MSSDDPYLGVYWCLNEIFDISTHRYQLTLSPGNFMSLLLMTPTSQSLQRYNKYKHTCMMLPQLRCSSSQNRYYRQLI